MKCGLESMLKDLVGRKLSRSRQFHIYGSERREKKVRIRVAYGWCSELEFVVVVGENEHVTVIRASTLGGKCLHML